MNKVQAASLRLADRTAQQVLGLWARVEAGELTTNRFRALAAAVIARANRQGVSLADIGLTAEVIKQTGRMVGPVGLQPEEMQVDQRRLADALEDIITAEVEAEGDALDESRRKRLERIARDEPLVTVSVSVQRGMERRNVPGWVRITDMDPCPLCRSWADGVVRPSTVRMGRHHGCSCIQQPVIT